MEKKLKIAVKFLLIFLCIFIPCREIIAYFTNSYIKFLPDLLIWSLLGLIIIKDKFKINIKIYDAFYLAFLLFGLFCTLINDVPLLSYLLQVRSITTMYALFYILRNSKLDLKDYHIVISILMLVSLSITVLGIGEFITSKELFFPIEWAKSIGYISNFNRVYSIMNNPNTYASFIIFVLLLIYSYGKKIEMKVPKIFYFLTFLGVFIAASRSAMILIAVFYIFLIFESFKNKKFKELITMFIILIFAFGFYAGLNKVRNISYENKIITNSKINHSINYNPVKPIEPSNPSEAPNGTVDRWNETISGQTLKNSLVDGRLYNIKKGITIFVDYPVFGTGFGTYGSAASKMVASNIYEKYNLYPNFYADNQYIVILVETGIIGTLIFCAFVISLFLYCIKNRYKLLILFSFLFVGLMYNVLEIPSVCMIVYLSFVLLDSKEKKTNIKKNKIAILGLHLNYGGVEQAIVNQANILCEDYDVELVITYKMMTSPAFKINPKVKIIYLTNLKPNKEEFLEALHKKQLFKLIKEGIKSFKILYLKKSTMKKFIKNSDAGIIISSRVEFTQLLSDNASENIIKIAEEHRHHNNDSKYINGLKKACENIDYLICVSKELTEFYQKKIQTTRCIHIPNCLDYLPNNKSKLNNKNLIAIGRLSKEKGFIDLISVFKEIDRIDPNFSLNIIGDGNERVNVENKIKELKLENKVKLHGFQNKDYINKYLEKSSLYLMTSFEESFGIVLIEAGSFGIPAIAFDSATGATEIIKNNESGYLIKNRDIKAMAKKVFELFNNKETLKKLGNNSRMNAEKYSFENVKQIWLNFLKEVKKNDE